LLLERIFVRCLYFWSELLLQLFCSTDQRARFGIEQLGIVLIKRFLRKFWRIK